MPAHIRTALTSQTLSLSVEHGRLLVGVWQGIYLWEHPGEPPSPSDRLPSDRRRQGALAPAEG
jgi:thiamine phosphate synthase YjbQ (UPF0047 family)